MVEAWIGRYPCHRPVDDSLITGTDGRDCGQPPGPHTNAETTFLTTCPVLTPQWLTANGTLSPTSLCSLYLLLPLFLSLKAQAILQLCMEDS